MDIIIGTAGHIDHGKTSLIKALTGIDADRLPEEKRRGITIDLGFAELDMGDVRIGFVDVPGHEKFVKNMLAGAHGIDLVALVIAADEGVMPQTREHFEICRLLETKSGLIVLTKKDLVEEEMLELVKLDVAELTKNSFLENAPLICVSTKTNEGIDELKKLFRELALNIPSRRNRNVALLPIDRTFTMKGFGAVVTGTLISGEINESAELEILPPGKKVRVRGLQTHGKPTGTAHSGQRIAVNLAGIDHTEIERGMVLCAPNTLRPTQILDAEIEVLKDAKHSLRSRQRVRLHSGTAEILARVQILGSSPEIAPGKKGFAQLRLESPVAVLPGERFILRSYSPQITIAGGKILDALAAKHRQRDFPLVIDRLQKLLSAYERNENSEITLIYLESCGELGARFSDLQARTGWLNAVLQESLKTGIQKHTIIAADDLYISRPHFDAIKKKTLGEVETHHKRDPLSRGILRETLREKIFAKIPSEIFRSVIASLVADKTIAAEGDVFRLAAHSRELRGDEKILFDRLARIFREAKFEVPTLDNALEESIRGTKLRKDQARKVFQFFLDSNEIVKVTDDFFFLRETMDLLRTKVKSLGAGTEIDVPKFKELAGVSRKYAIPLIEYFDRERVTRRVGDKRVIL